MNDLKVFETGDGSSSIIHPGLKETYHSRAGAIRESRYVYIDNGLLKVAIAPSETLFILEMGFGTGLNALLTVMAADNLPNPVHYCSVDTAPLPPEIWRQLNYGALLDHQEMFERIHTVDWNRPVELTPDFTLIKLHQSILDLDVLHNTHIIYYDAFAPSRQPELWTKDALARATRSLLPSGLFVTYCAKGQVKRDLKTLGFQVETLPGPPPKKEMIRCVKRQEQQSFSKIFVL